ncbi:MAG: hypothetical protein IKY94_06535 [Lachnospiraceae bacterium]|nr:hypothetical protein [Clostridia bacterium]MBR4982197.1 hypothetical protein [Lachnospiraceae bacterium]
MEKLNAKNKQIVERSIPVVKRARTRNLAFIFNLAARLLKDNNELVICVNFNVDTYILSINEVVYIKKLYSDWLLAYVKGYTNEKPTFVALAARTGYSLSQVTAALQNRPGQGYTLTYELMKQWGYIREY